MCPIHLAIIVVALLLGIYFVIKRTYFGIRPLPRYQAPEMPEGILLEIYKSGGCFGVPSRITLSDCGAMQLHKGNEEPIMVQSLYPQMDKIRKYLNTVEPRNIIETGQGSTAPKYRVTWRRNGTLQHAELGDQYEKSNAATAQMWYFVNDLSQYF